MKCKAQEGYALLALLVLLLSAGASWMSVSIPDRYSATSTTNAYLSAAEQASLVNARQTLLAYTALYPFLYGPAGAGPGHLPCPDTDGNSHNTPVTLSGTDQRRDGPDPPCTAYPTSSGWLPRHIVLPGNRYMFHADSRQIVEYRVSGRVVNNPTNRIVNLEDLMVPTSKPLAQLRLNASRADHHATVSITSRAMVASVSASVAAWVILRARLASRSDCPERSVNLPPHSAKGVDTGCDQQPLHRSSCPFDGVLVVVVDTPVVPTDSCMDDALESQTIEGIAAKRHWFIRNHWHESISLSSEQACKGGAVVDTPCVLVYSAPSSYSPGEATNRIVLSWIPSA